MMLSAVRSCSPQLWPPKAMARYLITSQDEKIKKGEPIIFDFGAWCKGYCSEIPSYFSVGRISEGKGLDVLYLDAKPATVELPKFINLRVVETEPDFRGDTAAGSDKPTRLETGLIISLSLFINNGDLIKIDTRTSAYIERVAKQ